MPSGRNTCLSYWRLIFLILLAGATLLLGCAREGTGANGFAVAVDASAPSGEPGKSAIASESDAQTVFTFVDAAASGPSGNEDAASDGGCRGDVCIDAPVAICGDGIINGTEQCDDGNTAPGDGCSASCRLEPGFACVTQAMVPNSVCHKTTCGDGVKEGFEQCDDGNLIPYDGCSPTCTLEPKCNGTGGCTGVCGDGLVFPPEQCDDGNTISGDGCSSTCMLETGTGYTCTNVNSPPAGTLNIPILYRDMLYHVSPAPLPVPGPTGGGHPDFNYDPYNVGNVLGLVFSPLPADGEPVLSSVGVPQTLTNAVDFCWWYHEKGCAGAGSTNPYDKLVYLDATGKPTTLPLTETAPGSNIYKYASLAFFPLDGLGWNAGLNPQTSTTAGTTCTNTGAHNFSFTSELHYVFTFDAAVAASATPTVFTFSGDDDVWAFINNYLIADLGGMHDPLPATLTLDTITAGKLGLTDGGWYSIDLFQAERHTCGSTYSLTLGGFVHTITQCKVVCGDGIAAGTEQCDNGTNNVPASSNPYGRGVCTDMCMLAPYCGDGIVQPQFGEKCDGGPTCDSTCQPKKAM